MYVNVNEDFDKGVKIILNLCTTTESEIADMIKGIKSLGGNFKNLVQVYCKQMGNLAEQISKWNHSKNGCIALCELYQLPYASVEKVEHCIMNVVHVLRRSCDVLNKAYGTNSYETKHSFSATIEYKLYCHVNLEYALSKACHDWKEIPVENMLIQRLDLILRSIYNVINKISQGIAKHSTKETRLNVQQAIEQDYVLALKKSF